jgi:hypothetical protein
MRCSRVAHAGRACPRRTHDRQSVQAVFIVGLPSGCGAGKRSIDRGGLGIEARPLRRIGTARGQRPTLKPVPRESRGFRRYRNSKIPLYHPSASFERGRSSPFLDPTRGPPEGSGHAERAIRSTRLPGAAGAVAVGSDLAHAPEDASALSRLANPTGAPTPRSTKSGTLPKNPRGKDRTGCPSFPPGITSLSILRLRPAPPGGPLNRTAWPLAVPHGRHRPESRRYCFQTATN